MSLKKFHSGDIINTVLAAKPEMNFIIHSGRVYLQKERPTTGSFNNAIKHVDSGHISLYEMNVNRSTDSMISSYIEKSSTRYAFGSVTGSQFDDDSIYEFGDKIVSTYPLSASISRIYIPHGPSHPSGNPNHSADGNGAVYTTVHGNKKYIRALQNPISSTGRFGVTSDYGHLTQSSVNLICIPGIFYGSSVDPGSIELNYYITGALCATAKDLYADGRIVQTYPATGSLPIGVAIYNQGILALTGSEVLSNSDLNYLDNFLSDSSTTGSTWLTFGTGISQVGTAVTSGSAVNSSYSVSFKGVSNIPTMTMFAYSEKGEDNFSHNPTFLKSTSGARAELTENQYIESKRDVKKVNKSVYADYEENFDNNTYISKVGIYDENKNLIAIATLANPIKKTEKRDFMIKMRLDF